MGIVDLLFPRLCVGCGISGRYVCLECLNKLYLKKEQICPMCAKRSISGTTHFRCRKGHGIDGLISVFEYHGLVRKLVGKLKYGLVKDLKEDLLELVASFGDFDVIGKESWAVVAVPLYVRRLRKRGFNQAELIGEMVADYFGWTFDPELLVRKKETEEQQKLSKKKRIENLKGAFCLSNKLQTTRDKVTDKRFLLVDDVWTTGSTMRECGRVLKRVGAKKVWGLVFAS